MLTELLSLSGLALATAVSCNAYAPLAGWLGQWAVVEPTRLKFTVFLLLLLILSFAFRMAIKVLSQLIQWERVHWAVQGLGVIVGCARGAWLGGVCALLLVATGMPALTESVTERSMVGPSLVRHSTTVIQLVADWLPHPQRDELVPRTKFQLPSLPRTPGTNL